MLLGSWTFVLLLDFILLISFVIILLILCALTARVLCLATLLVLIGKKSWIKCICFGFRDCGGGLYLLPCTKVFL